MESANVPVRNNRRNSAGVPMSLIQSASHLLVPDQNTAYGSETVQPPPLKRARTSQPSRHQPSPTSTYMAPSYSTPYTGATTMVQVPNVTVSRQLPQHLMQSSLPYRPTQGLHDFDEMGLDGIGMEPGQYLSARGYGGDEQLLPFLGSQPPLPIPHAQSLSAEITQSDLATAAYSLPSSCGSLTEDATLDTVMSGRFSDGHNDNVSLPIDMAHVDSRDSYLGQYNIRPGISPAQGYSGTGAETSLDKSYFGSDDDVRGIGSKYLHMGQTLNVQRSASGPGFPHQNAQGMERSESVNTYSSFGLNLSPESETFAFQDYADPHVSADMERSISSASARSSVSLRLRAKTSLLRQLDNATKNQLQPKMSAPLNPVSDTMLPQSSPPTAALDVAAGDGINNGKVEITKAKRERPKTKKLFCNLCNQRPEGFRGEHELRRHKSAKHGPVSKKWICRDARVDNIETTVEAIRPLSDCKHCREGKTYGAYYNAAAHLRRTHFKKKAPRKGSSRTPSVDNSAEADASAEWPTMNELKKWMVEITVPADQSDSVSEAGDADDMVDDEYIEDEASFDESPPASASAAIGGMPGDISFQNYPFLGMGFAFPPEAATAVRGSERAPASSADLQAEMARQGDAIQSLYAQGPISSANFLEPQAGLGHLFPDLSGFDSSEIVSSPSGTTVTQGTAHPINDLPLDASRFDFAQSFANADSLEFDFLAPI